MAIAAVIVLLIACVYTWYKTDKSATSAQLSCRQAHEWAEAAQTTLETARSSNKATEKFVADTLISMKVLLDRAETAAADASRRAQAAKDSGDLTYKYLLDTEKLRKDAHGAADSAKYNAAHASNESAKAQEHAEYSHAQATKAHKSAEVAADAVPETRKSVVLSQNHALDAAKSAQVSEKSSTESREHMLAAHQMAKIAEAHAVNSEAARDSAQDAEIIADKHVQAAATHAKTAAEHVAVASRVSVMVRDLASQAGVKLVPAGKIYGTDGSNIGKGK